MNFKPLLLQYFHGKNCVVRCDTGSAQIINDNQLSNFRIEAGNSNMTEILALKFEVNVAHAFID